MESFGAVSRASTEMQGRPLNLTSEVSAIEGHSCGGDQYYQESDVLVGRQDAEKELISRLIDNTEENLGVILVMSEEAVGKTALARHVYNRLDIRKHFPLRVWLHVRKEFAYKDLLLIVLKQTPIRILKDLELMSEQELCQMVFETLVKFKFLVVLDDVCTVDVWVKLLRAFADAGNGSRIILTTRHSNVESQVVPWSCPPNLRQLTKEESWVLFLKKVDSRRAEKCSDINTEEVNNFRERILGICQGLPPVILLLGGLLSALQLSEWSRVIDREHQLPLLNSVALMSYDELPSDGLRNCFLYLALFPKAYEIPKRRFLHLWLAEGFFDQMSSEPEASVPEDKAKIYLEELVSRSMIEICRRNSDGSPKTCRMPCFLYDVFLPKAKEKFLHVHHCRTENCSSADSFNVQRLADHFGVTSTSKAHTRNLCSYVSFNAEKQGTSNREISMLLKKIINGRHRFMLKVLDLEGVYKPLLPEKLGELRNLKYLGLRWTGLDSCPTSIGDLSNLETIDLKYTSITTLPSSIWKANKLRHLYMNEVSIPKPLKVFSTNQLQTLMGLFIGSKDPGIFGLDRFTNLRKLGLTCHSKSKEQTANYISQLGNLQTLRLRSRDPFGQPLELVLSPMRNHQSLSNLYLFGVITDGISNLPRNLKMLTLSMSELKEDPMPVLGVLPQLNSLRLFSGSYVGSEMTCLPDHFPKLIVLKLWNLDQLKQWTVEEGAMPQLLELEIRRCEELVSSDGLELLPALKELILTNMPQNFVANVRLRLARDILLTNTWDLSPLFACKLNFFYSYLPSSTRRSIAYFCRIGALY